jgi:sugar lactone lactonase YvrE
LSSSGKIPRRNFLISTVAGSAGLVLQGQARASEVSSSVLEIGGLHSPQGVTSNPQAAPFFVSGSRILRLMGRNSAKPLVDTGGRPAGLSFDAGGNLYAADRRLKAILKITPWGAATVLTDQCGGVAFSAPARLAMAMSGDIYFTDTGASRVYRANGRGETALFASEVHHPTGIAVATSGQVFIGDAERNIWKYRPGGKGRTAFAHLSDVGEPSGMALDEKGNLYIARDGGAKVSVLSPEGKPIASYAVPGPRVTDVGFGGFDLRSLYVTEAQTGAVYSLRVPYRVQRLPWEPDEPLRITEPVDGAILNRHDGETTPDGLRIRVKGFSRTGDSVRINGRSVPVHDGQFESELLLRERETKIVAAAPGELSQEITVLWDRDSFPRYRVSVDDNILFFKDITLHADSYKSIFDNPYLAMWRAMHRKYGTKVHFNIYYETEGFNLSQMPAKYRPEWQANADWLHLSFHARADKPDWPYVFASPEKVVRDYRLVTSEIKRFAGTEVLGPYISAHWSTMTREAARALRAEGVRGLDGYFEVENNLPFVCDYLPLAQWRYLGVRNYWRDMQEDLFLFRVVIIMNNVKLEEIVPHIEQVVAHPHQAEVLELKIHEQYFYPDYIAYEPDYRERVERAIEWVTRHGYKPMFYSEGFMGTSAK